MEKRRSAPNSSARCLSSGSSRLCVMNSRIVGLTSRTPSFRLGMNQASSSLASERFHRYDRAVLNELLFGLLTHNLFNSDGAQNLHGPLAYHCGAGMNRGPAMMFNRQRRYSMMTKEQRGRHANQATANDQNWDFEVRHLSTGRLHPNCATDSRLSRHVSQWRLDESVGLFTFVDKMSATPKQVIRLTNAKTELFAKYHARRLPQA